MNLSEVFIKRPVATTLLVLAITIFGVMGYRQLPVSDLPTIDFPTIQVQASLPGASPETMATAVATPLEKQFSAIAGLDSMNSLNAQGLTQITLQFTLDRNIDAAAQDVQAAIAAAQPQLPPGMPTPPSYKKVNPADQPILYLSLSSPTLPLYVVDEYAQTNLAQRISTIAGVAQVQIFGSQKYAVRAQLDPNTMATLGIGIDEVQKALADSNVNLPTGTLWGPILKEKTFFMVSYEHLRDVQPEPSTYTVPTMLMRQGNFSEWTAFQVFDPLTATGSTNQRTPLRSSYTSYNRDLPCRTRRRRPDRRHLKQSGHAYLHS